jgi:hypothetical protein
MQDMIDQHHDKADEVVVTADVIEVVVTMDVTVVADVTEVDVIDQENEDVQEAMIVERVDHVADRIDGAVAAIEAEKEEVVPTVDQKKDQPAVVVKDQTVVVVTKNDRGPDPAQDLDPPPNRKLKLP